MTTLTAATIEADPTLPIIRITRSEALIGRAADASQNFEQLTEPHLIRPPTTVMNGLRLSRHRSTIAGDVTVAVTGC